MKKNDMNIDSVIQELAASFKKDGAFDQLDSSRIPSRAAVRKVLDQTRQVLFPGCFGEPGIDESNVKYYVGDLLNEIMFTLTREIYKAYTAAGEEWHSLRQSTELAGTFLEQIPRIRELLKKDIQAAYEGDPAAKSLTEVIVSYPCVQTITVYRLAHELYLLGVPLIPRMMSEFSHSKTGMDIHPGAEIGEFFFIDHGTGVVIGETTVIGNNVKLYQGVTLGALSFPRDPRGKLIKGLKRHPTIRDNVTIYANATILGGETVIGEGAVIAANAWIVNSVKAGQKVK